MPMKILKTDGTDELRIERLLILKHYSLALDKKLCKGCGICAIVCPKEAIEIAKAAKSATEEKVKPPTVDLSGEKCVFCGICDAICPFGALTLRVDGNRTIPVVNTESFPQVIRNVKIDTKKCEVGCSDCEEACPLGIIRIRRVSPLERAREITKSKTGNATLKPLADVQLGSCPGCGLCESVCPQKAISTRRIFQGSFIINHEKCPEGCHHCLDVCPFRVLHLSDDGKMEVDEPHCTYCGVCKIVCPVPNALEMQRTYISHTSVRSGAWNKALEKLTNTKILAKELRAKSQANARKSVERRLAPHV